MNYQKVCYTSPILHVADILIIALVLAAFVVRFRHQGFLVHGSYWLVAWIQDGDRGFENIILAGLIHIVAVSACFIYARAAGAIPGIGRTSRLTQRYPIRKKRV